MPEGAALSWPLPDIVIRRKNGFRGVDRYVYERVRDFLARRHKVARRGTRRFSYEVVYGERGLLRLERLPLSSPPRALR